MSIEEIRKRHEHDEIYGRDTRSDNVIHQDRAELLRVIDALLEIRVDEHDGVALLVGDTQEAIEILRGEGGDE